MEENFYPGKFIVMEGLNGCGKTTQIELLQDYFPPGTIITKEPTLDSVAGRKARNILNRKMKTSSGELQKLFSEDRQAHLNNLIIPGLRQGKTIISDRYFFSTFAFGGLDLDMDWLIKLNNNFLLPNLTFILKTSPETCLERINKRGGKIRIFEEKEKLKKVWANYETLTKKFKNIHIINGEQSIKKVHKNIIKIINKEIMNIAKIIDHTNIELTAKAKDIIKTCREAKKYGFRSVCINPQWVKTANKELADSEVKIVVLIDPPMGLSSTAERLRMAKKAKNEGANELDIVINIVDLKYERYNKISQDLKQLCKILPTKIIIGSGFLTDEEIKKASQLVKKSGAICVKTATFKDPLEHRELKEKAYHLKLMRESAPGLLIKASGKISSPADVKAMIKAGADIIGTSSGVKIIEKK
ncbi:MAG: deoxyribose-phosphate aldolase [bacterium]